MKALRLAFWLAVMIPAWCLLGCVVTLHSGAATWQVLTLGAIVGVYFGLLFGAPPLRSLRLVLLLAFLLFLLLLLPG